MPKKANNIKVKKASDTVEEIKPVITDDAEEENPKKDIDPDLVDSMFEEPIEPDEEDEDDIFAGADEEEEQPTW